MMNYEKPTPIQKRIEDLVTNGLGFESTFDPKRRAEITPGQAYLMRVWLNRHPRTEFSMEDLDDHIRKMDEQIGIIQPYDSSHYSIDPMEVSKCYYTPLRQLKKSHADLAPKLRRKYALLIKKLLTYDKSTRYHSVDELAQEFKEAMKNIGGSDFHPAPHDL